MRPRVLLPALLIAGALVGLAVWVNTALRAPSASSADAAPAPPPSDSLARVYGSHQPPPTLKPPGLLHHGESMPSYDSEAGGSILADLEKPAAEIQQAALQRAKELGDRALIPRLREAEERIDDPLEKAAILDAIDFLKLPTLAENMAEAQAARAAAGLPDPPQSLTNRWTGKPFIRKQ